MLAVRPDASLVVGDPSVLHARAGAAFAQRAGGRDRIDGATLLALGLAAFAVEGDPETALAAIGARAETISALVRARRISDPGWYGADADLAIEHDAPSRTVTLRLRNASLPSFTIRLLETMDTLFARWRREGVEADALLFTSATPAVFSMGGHLATIAALARRRDTGLLRHYAHTSARVVHALWTGLDRGIVTVGAVDGKAFGSGFEAIAACHVAVAGKGAVFAFPEARFGLFPGMGGTSLIGRRASPALAEALILSGRKLEACEAFELGIVDALAHGETAEAHARRAICARTPEAAAMRGAALSRRQAHPPYALEEAFGVVDVWVEAVLDLSEARLSEIERIARMQNLRYRNRK